MVWDDKEMQDAMTYLKPKRTPSDDPRRKLIGRLYMFVEVKSYIKKDTKILLES